MAKLSESRVEMAQLVTVVCYALQQVVYGTVDSLVYVQVMVMVVSGDDCRCRDGEQGCKIADRKHQTYTVLLGVDQVWPLHAPNKKHATINLRRLACEIS